MKIKTSNLIGPALDWAVAKCEGYQAVFTNGSIRPVFRKCEAVEGTWPCYSTEWVVGGPIIEREKIEVRWVITDSEGGGYWWTQNLFTDTYGRTGSTPLIAAMHCYVASKLGEEVDIPDELTW